MIKRIVSYDIKEGGDYQKFYDLVRKYSATQLTESTYLFFTNLSQSEFEQEIRSSFSDKDNVYYITSNATEGLFAIKII